MEGQLGLSELSVISWVSAVEGCPGFHCSQLQVICFFPRLYTVHAQCATCLMVCPLPQHSVVDYTLLYVHLGREENFQEMHKCFHGLWMPCFSCHTCSNHKLYAYCFNTHNHSVILCSSRVQYQTRQQDCI